MINLGILTYKTGLAPNCYAQWHLNELAGIVASDSSGNGRDGTTINAPLWVPGKLNNCLQFNGTNQYVNCGNIASFERTDPFSLECWFKTSSASTQILISKNQGVSPNRGWQINLESGRIAFYLVNIYPTNFLYVNTVSTFANGFYHHCIVTYNGNSLASGIKIYVDVSLRAVTVSSNNLTDTIINSTNCQIGAKDGILLPFNGQIDESLIYTKVLSASEVAFRWNSGIGTENLN